MQRSAARQRHIINARLGAAVLYLRAQLQQCRIFSASPKLQCHIVYVRFCCSIILCRCNATPHCDILHFRCGGPVSYYKCVLRRVIFFMSAAALKHHIISACCHSEAVIAARCGAAVRYCVFSLRRCIVILLMRAARRHVHYEC